MMGFPEIRKWMYTFLSSEYIMIKHFKNFIVYKNEFKSAHYMWETYKLIAEETNNSIFCVCVCVFVSDYFYHIKLQRR